MAEIVNYGRPPRVSRQHTCDPEATWTELAGNTEPGESTVLLCDCGTVWRYHYFFDNPVGWVVANAWLAWRTRRWVKRARQQATPKGGYPAGDRTPSQLAPPPAELTNFLGRLDEPRYERPL